MNSRQYNDINLANLKPNPDWARLPIFDRSGWETVRFGDVVECVNETCDPAEAGIERFIGLEHMESGSLHVREWGNVADGTTFTRRCRPGQVLFGKRRAYQRKVAVAEFDAVVSGDIYVLTPRGDRLLPELLPFICMSERFFQFAVETSAGSLSPRTNWSHLAQFEFALPILDHQRRIAEILWAVDDVCQLYGGVGQSANGVRLAAVDAHFDALWQSSGLVHLSELADVSYGITLGSHRTDLPERRTYLRVANVQREQLDLSEIKVINCTADEAARFSLAMGDVLIVEGHASVDEIGRSAVWRSELPGMLHQNHLIRAHCGKALVPEYLDLLVNSRRGRAYFRARAKSSSGLNTINSTVVKELPVPVVSIERQAELVKHAGQLRVVVSSASSAASRLRSTLETILNEVVQ